MIHLSVSLDLEYIELMAAEQLATFNANDDNMVAQVDQKPHENPLCAKFLLAALTANWKAAEKILEEDEDLVRAHINTSTKETVLQILAGAAEKKHAIFFAKFLDKMKVNDLEIRNSTGSTALHFAASAGNREIATMLVERNARLPGMANDGNVTPLYMAVLSGHNDMAQYLLQYANFGPGNATYGCTILNTSISTALYGIASQMVGECSLLAVSKDENKEGPLLVLARKPSAFVCEGEGKGHKRLWYKIIYPSYWKKVKQDEYLPTTTVCELLNQIWRAVEIQRNFDILITEDIIGLLFVAANVGNFGFLVDLLRRHPDLLYKVNDKNHTIFHIAVMNRYEHIFSLIYEIGSLKGLLASYKQDDENNMLHLAAKLGPPSQLGVLPGSALQMQRELLWYKEVEKIVPPSYRNMKNEDKKTPHELFMEEHHDLMKDGEKWMKRTAHACMIVATLIATVVFTTAFTIPGGNNGQNGMPILLGKRFFVVFMISEIIAMISSSTSIIMFLCILTSRYAEKDFFESLPFWLLTGTTTLFLSLAAMMIAFCTTFLICNHHGLANVPTLLGLSALVPLMFLWFKYPLLVDILSSTYGSNLLFRSRGRLFYSCVST